jgi:hypothetical protein
LTISKFCCSSRFIGGDKHPNKKTGTTGPTDGQTGGDKHPNKTTGTTGPNDGQTGGDKHSNKTTGTAELK